ncbi:MAG: dienelactone hydrolase family protein [Armatimonadetes bacterium]|nr:dienelactone hydrolase family protein [Armatimonadota bacterium]
MKLSRRHIFAALALAALPTPGFAGDTAPGSHAHTIALAKDAAPRSYRLYIPPGYDKAKPATLVVMLHGRGGDAVRTGAMYGWNDLADKNGFVVAYPEALPDSQEQRAWNAVFTTGQKADDVAFLSALLAHLQTSLAVDTKRVYLVGHSSGAMMTYRFAAEKGDTLAAIGVVAGSIGSDFGVPGATGGRTIRVAKPVAPVPLVAFHGKADPIVPFDWHDKKGEPPIFRFVPAPESVRLFVSANGAEATPKREESFAGNVVKETFVGKSGADVVFYQIGDGNHKWPGAKYTAEEEASSYGAANKQVNATALIWEFFKAHPR